MKFLKLFVFFAIISVLLASCSDKDEDNTSAKSDDTSVVYKEEPAIPEGFVFPGESSEESETVVPTAASHKERAIATKEYISGYADLSEYAEYPSEKDGEYAIDLILDKSANNGRDISYGVLLGTEKAEVTLPTTVASLLDAGFTWLEEKKAEDQLVSDSYGMVTLCTPKTKEIFGFITANHQSSTISTKEALVSGITLTSYNNFSACEGITGSSDVGELLVKAGLPNIISVTASDNGDSILLEYDDPDGTGSVLMLSDGGNKSLIAVNISAE